MAVTLLSTFVILKILLIAQYSNLRYPRRACVRGVITVVCVCVCVCVSVTTKGSAWYVYTLKVRYHRILHELLKSFDVWISLKVFSLRHYLD